MMDVPSWSHRNLTQCGTYGGLDGVHPTFRAVPCCTSRPLLLVFCKVSGFVALALSFLTGPPIIDCVPCISA